MVGMNNTTDVVISEKVLSKVSTIFPVNITSDTEVSSENHDPNIHFFSLF